MNLLCAVKLFYSIPATIVVLRRAFEVEKCGNIKKGSIVVGQRDIASVYPKYSIKEVTLLTYIDSKVDQRMTNK